VDAVISPVISRSVIVHEDLSLQVLLAVGDMILRSIRT